MFSDQNGSSVCFIEKPTRAQVEENVKRFDVDFVFCNAFVFAMGGDAAQGMREIYGAAKLSTGKLLFESAEFDWSGHVLSPLSLVHARADPSEWFSSVYRTASSKKYFPADSDWKIIFDLAREFYARFGPIKVWEILSFCLCFFNLFFQILNCGEHSLWYDCGLAADVMELSFRPEVEQLFPEVLRHGASRFVRSLPIVEAADCVFVDSSLSKSVAANHCLFIECSDVGTAPISGISNSLFYRIDFAVDSEIKLQSDTVHFSYIDGQGRRRVGSFPLNENPKNGGLSKVFEFVFFRVFSFFGGRS